MHSEIIPAAARSITRHASTGPATGEATLVGCEAIHVNRRRTLPLDWSERLLRGSKLGSDPPLMKLRRRCGLVQVGIRAMQSFHAPQLLPPGFCAVEGIERRRQGRHHNAREEPKQPVPFLWGSFGRIHNRYPRHLADLPIAGQRVILTLQARHFRFVTVPCERRIFTERFDDQILKPRARRTPRLDRIVHCLALALGGRPAVSFARRLSIPISNDTLLRAVRKRGTPIFSPPVIIGIDDWAWRRNHRYGTLICDLER
jgi:hypothetical protein